MRPSLARALLWTAGGAAILYYVGHYDARWGSMPQTAPLSLPDPGKTLGALGTLGILAALLLAALALGRLLERRLGLGDALADLRGPVRLGLGLLVLADCVLLLGVLRLLFRPVLAALVLVPAAAGLVLARGHLAGLRVRRPSATALVILALAAPSLLLAFSPDVGWDALVYHLAIPERYLFENRVVVTPFSLFTVFPHTQEMLYLVALALDGEALAKLLHLGFGALAAWVAWALARRTSPRAGILALAVLAADPLFLWETTVAYNDLAAAFYVLLAAAALHEGLTGVRGGLVLCGIFAGACAATRYTAAPVVPAVLLVALFAGRSRGWRAALRSAAVVAAAAAAIVAPWLLRNLALTGNPVSPALQGLFHAPGHEYFSPVVVEQTLSLVHEIGMGRGVLDLLALPWNLTMRAGGDYGAFGFRIGVLYLVGTLAALLSGQARRTGLVAMLLTLAGVLVLAWFYGAQEPRFLLPALALLAVAGGVGLDALGPRGRGPALVPLALPALAVLHAQWSWPGRLLDGYRHALGRAPAASAETGDPAFHVARRLRGALPPGSRLLLVHEARSYYFRGLDYLPAHHTKSGSPVLQLVRSAGDADDLAARLRALGVTHVLVNSHALERHRTAFVAGYTHDAFLADLNRLHAFLEADTVPVLSAPGVYVRRLRPPGGGP